MNLFDSRNLTLFAYLALLGTLAAVLTGFNGKVTVEIKPFSGRVVVDGHSKGCLIDPHLPEQSQPIRPNQKIA
ncbi:hypothetical protein BV372_22885 [Nostoc sp. T09]|nr:hypothetical protein BV372_22885 [Nostoc sp. T09]